MNFNLRSGSSSHSDEDINSVLQPRRNQILANAQPGCSNQVAEHSRNHGMSRQVLACRTNTMHLKVPIPRQVFNEPEQILAVRRQLNVRNAFPIEPTPAHLNLSNVSIFQPNPVGFGFIDQPLDLSFRRGSFNDNNSTSRNSVIVNALSPDSQLGSVQSTAERQVNEVEDNPPMENEASRIEGNEQVMFPHEDHLPPPPQESILSPQEQNLALLETYIANGHYFDVITFLEGNTFDEKYHKKGQALWDRAYQSMYAHIYGQLSRYRLGKIKRDHPYPPTIWDGFRVKWGFRVADREVLIRKFANSRYPDKDRRTVLAGLTRLSLDQVTRWFINARRPSRTRRNAGQ